MAVMIGIAPFSPERVLQCLAPNSLSAITKEKEEHPLNREVGKHFSEKQYPIHASIYNKLQ